MSASVEPIRRTGVKDLVYRLAFTRRLREKPYPHLHMIRD
jgi:hypothetical protein